MLLGVKLIKMPPRPPLLTSQKPPRQGCQHCFEQTMGTHGLWRNQLLLEISFEDVATTVMPQRMIILADALVGSFREL